MLKRRTLYICYLGIRDPLVWTQVAAYLGGLATSGFVPTLLTFEPRAIRGPERDAIVDRLASSGIRWTMIESSRAPSPLRAFVDIRRGVNRVRAVARENGVNLLHGRSDVGAAIAYAVRRSLPAPFIYDFRGLLAEEYADSGHWARNGPLHRTTRRGEHFLLRRADGVVLLTRAVETMFASAGRFGSDRQVRTVIPCCVDEAQYRFAPGVASEERQRRGWQSRRVLIYSGKLGTWYQVDELARFLQVARRHDPRFFLQALSTSEPHVLADAMSRAGVHSDAFGIARLDPRDVPRVLAAADAGISFRAEGLSRVACSPTKVGEYLAAGLPVVSSAGLGDCDALLSDDRVGVLVRDWSESEFERAVHELQALLDETDVRQRSKRVVSRELSLSGVGVPRYRALYERLLEGRPVT